MLISIIIISKLIQLDLILKINEKTMSKVDFFEKEMGQMIKVKSKRIVFFVKRGIHTLFLELEPDWDNT